MRSPPCLLVQQHRTPPQTRGYSKSWLPFRISRSIRFSAMELLASNGREEAKRRWASTSSHPISASSGLYFHMAFSACCCIYGNIDLPSGHQRSFPPLSTPHLWMRQRHFYFTRPSTLSRLALVYGALTSLFFLWP